QYEVSLTPQYSGLSGSPIRFGITNELAVTTAPGPYTIRLYTDNPAITLTASQDAQQASYRYSWLAACNSSQPAPNRPPVAQPIPDQVLVVGQPYQLELSNYFTDPEGQTLTFTAGVLPAGLSLSGSRISGSPTQAGTVTVQLTALDPGGLQAEGSVVLRVDPAPVTPTPGVFSIAGVTGVRCETVTASERRLIFSPVYTGLTGEPISFGITNEVAPTSAPGPYSVRLYTDNPAITLTATQGSSQASYRYNWLEACASNPPTPPTGNRAPVVGTGLGDQTATAGQGYTLFIPAGTFTDPDNDALQLSVSGLPAGLSFSSVQNAITGTPAQAGSATVQVTATDPGGLSTSLSFVLTVQPAASNPTPGVFSIAGVTGVRCETVTASERRLIFSPVYTGLTGEPISFGITNEVAPTNAPGPYSVRLYTDNPAITLTATQGSSQASYRYNWLAACTTPANGRQAVVEAGSPLSVVVLGNPVVGESADVLIGGVAGQAVELILTDLAGNRLHQQSIPQVSGTERVVVPVPAGQAMTILKVSTATQHQSVKLIRQ
ncbi:putative Ig domain-containing protein, partial [Spirosoma oryzae]